MQAAEYQYLYAAEQRLWWLRAVHLAVRRLLPAPSGQRLLELGCGTGGLLSVLQRAGYQVTGLDLRQRSRALQPGAPGRPSAARQRQPVALCRQQL